MKLKINKNTINRYLEYHFIFILITACLSYVLLFTTLNYIHKYKEEEKIHFFIEGQYIKDDELKTELFNNIEGLYEVNYNICSSTSDNLSTIYEAYFKTSDIYILREQDFIDMDYLIKDVFMPIDNNSEIFKDINYPFTYFQYDNINYAFKIFDKNNDEFNNSIGFINFMEFDNDLDNFYIAINKDSKKFNNDENGLKTGTYTLNYMLRRYING